MPWKADAGSSRAIAVLEDLAARLAADGWQVRLHAPPDRRPMLHVANSSATMLSDLVTTDEGSDGRWWLWWSWAERISPAEDLDKAAKVIGRVLASHEAAR